MRILVLCYEYPPLGGGGGRAAKVVAEALVQRGHEVRFQTAGMSHLPKRETVNGVEVFRTESFRKKEERCTVPEMGLFLATSFLPTLRHVRQWEPDVIHAHFAVPTGALAYAVHRLTRVPFVLTVQLGDVPGGVPEQTDHLFRRLDPFIRPIWQKAAGITVVSEFVADLARRAYGQDVMRIPNGISLAGRAETPSPPHDPLRLLAVGRFNPQKNFPFLIETMAQLRELRWQLDLVGDGDERAAITAAIAQHGLQERIRLHGWLSEAKVERLMSESDVLCMPSLSEGLPVTGVEALKHGLAFLGSRIGGLLDVIDDGVNGWLIPLDQPTLFPAKLRELLENPSRLHAMKQASHEKARQFELATVAAQYETVLAAATQRR